MLHFLSQLPEIKIFVNRCNILGWGDKICHFFLLAPWNDFWDIENCTATLCRPPLVPFSNLFPENLTAKLDWLTLWWSGLMLCTACIEPWSVTKKRALQCKIVMVWWKWLLGSTLECDCAIQLCDVIGWNCLLVGCSALSQVVPHCRSGEEDGQWREEIYSFFTFTFL